MPLVKVAPAEGAATDETVEAASAEQAPEKMPVTDADGAQGSVSVLLLLAALGGIACGAGARRPEHGPIACGKPRTPR